MPTSVVSVIRMNWITSRSIRSGSPCSCGCVRKRRQHSVIKVLHLWISCRSRGQCSWVRKKKPFAEFCGNIGALAAAPRGSPPRPVQVVLLNGDMFTGPHRACPGGAGGYLTRGLVIALRSTATRAVGASLNKATAFHHLCQPRGDKPLDVADNAANTLVSPSATGFHFPQDSSLNQTKGPRCNRRPSWEKTEN